MIKKFLILSLIFSLLFSSVSAAGYSEPSAVKITPVTIQSDTSAKTGSAYMVSSLIESDCPEPVPYSRRAYHSPEEYLYSQLAAHAETVDLSSYNLSINQGLDLFWKVIFSHPELPVLPYANPAYSGSILVYITPKYIYDSAEQDKAHQLILEDKVNKVAQYADSMGATNLEKILFAYQEIVENYSYDFISLDTDTGSYDLISHTAYAFADYDAGVCQAYSLFYYMVLDKLGIESDLCSNLSEINHIWNYINLDGKWYHSDVTFGDADTDGITDFTYFLFDDNFDSKHGSKNYWDNYILDYQPQCTDKEYESGYIFNNSYSRSINKKDDKFSFSMSVSYPDGTIGAVSLYSKNIKISKALFSDINSSDTSFSVITMLSDNITARTDLVVNYYSGSRYLGTKLPPYYIEDIPKNSFIKLNYTFDIPLKSKADRFKISLLTDSFTKPISESPAVMLK